MADITAPEVTTESPAAQVEGDAAGEGQSAPDEVGVLKKLVSGLKRNLSRRERRDAEHAVALKAAADEIASLKTQLTGTQKKDALGNLKVLKRQALEAQDWDRVMEIDDKIAEVSRIPVQAKKIQTPTADIDPVVADEDADAFKSWMTEKAEDGSFKRPWTQPDHPKYKKAAQIGAAVFEDDDFPTFEEKVAEIDRLMTPKGKAVQTAAAVLSGSGAPAAKKAGPKLSDQEKRIAERWYDSLPAAEAHAKWAANKASAPKGAIHGAAGNA